MTWKAYEIDGELIATGPDEWMPVFKREEDRWVWTRIWFPGCLRFMPYADVREFEVEEGSFPEIRFRHRESRFEEYMRKLDKK